MERVGYLHKQSLATASRGDLDIPRGIKRQVVASIFFDSRNVLIVSSKADAAAKGSSSRKKLGSIGNRCVSNCALVLKRPPPQPITCSGAFASEKLWRIRLSQLLHI